MTYQPLVSIIIPTYNEEKYLPKLLESLKKQDYKNHEIIIADAGSKDKTVAQALQYPVKIVAGGQPAEGRNNGAKAAQGDYFIFLDADVIVPENFLNKAVAEFDKNYYTVATFKHQPISDLRLDRLIFRLTNKLVKTTVDLYPYAFGSAMMSTKRVFYKINGFDEKLYLAEDHDFAIRAKRYGRYGFIDKTYVNVSVRRLDNEGRVNAIKKYFTVEMHRALKGKIDKKVIEYDFGNFKNRDLNKLEKYLENLLKKY